MQDMRSRPVPPMGSVRFLPAWRTALRSVDQCSLTVTAGPAFTAKWLAPRLFKFAQAHPEIELRFSASLRLKDFSRDDIDLAIRFGLPKDEPGLFSLPVIHEWVTPMMSPDLAKDLPEPADLARAPLLHQDDTAFLKAAVDWPAWFRAANLPPRFSTGTRFSQADHALDAAIAGAGVVLGRISLAERDIVEGRLVMPYNLALASEAQYRVICPEGAENRAQIRAFIDWLEAETRSLEALKSGMTFVDAADLSG